MASLVSPDMKRELRSLRDLVVVWPIVVSLIAGFAAVMNAMMSTLN